MVVWCNALRRSEINCNFYYIILFVIYVYIIQYGMVLLVCLVASHKIVVRVEQKKYGGGVQLT